MTDQKTVRLVIGTLAALALSVVIGGIYLAAVERGLPGELIAIGSAAAGAISGILAKTSTGPMTVTVGNEANDPIPTAEAGHADTALLTTVAVVIIAVVAVLFAFGAVPT